MEFIPFEKIKKEWMKDPEFQRMQEEGKPSFEFAKMILSLREKHSLTQEDLAEKLKITRSEVSHMESGDYNADLELVYRIAGAFNYKVEVEFK